MANIVIRIRMSNGDNYLADTLIDADSTDDTAQANAVYEMVLGSRFLVVRLLGAGEDDPTTMLWSNQVVSITVTKADPADPAEYQLMQKPQAG